MAHLKYKDHTRLPKPTNAEFQICKFGISQIGSLVSLVVTMSHICYQMAGAGWDRVQIPLGLNSVAMPVVYLAMLSP